MPNRGINWPFMPKPLTRNRTNRFAGFAVHFFYGAALGSAAGLMYWILFSSDPASTPTGLRCISSGLLLGGLLVGIAQDRFGSDLRQKLRPPPPPKRRK
jgi:hypothetical protein